MKDEVDLLPTDKHKRFLQIVTMIWGVWARHAQITQNSKFAIFLQYLKKEVSDEVDFLHADKHERLLQIDTMILIRMIEGMLRPLFYIDINIYSDSIWKIMLNLFRKTIFFNVLTLISLFYRYHYIRYFIYSVCM